MTAVEDPLLSIGDEPCDCVPGCESKLVECGCETALEQLTQLLQQDERTQPRRFETRSGADGTFALSGLPDGRYSIWARLGRGVAAVGGVAAGAEEIVLALEPAVTWRGRAVDRHKEGIAGAVVVATKGSLLVRMLSGPDGALVLQDVPDGSWEVVATSPGLLAAHASVLGGRYGGTEIELPPPSTLRGRVVRAGEPVAGAEVHLQRGHFQRAATTDTRGDFSFVRLRPEELELSTILGPECARATATPEPVGKPGPPVTLSLGACRPVSGTVKGSGGEPLAARVTLRRNSESAGSSVQTGPDGSFRFFDVSPALDWLEVRSPGYEFLERDWSPRETGPLSIVLRRAVAVRGVVRDLQSSRPLPAATVRVVDPRRGDRWLESTETKADGSFSVEGIPAGEFVLEVERDGFLDDKRLVKVPDEGLEVLLDPGATAEGRVVGPDGSPCVGARVDLLHSPKDWRTDLEGRFRIPGLARGQHVFEIDPPDDLAAVPVIREFVVAGERLIHFDMRLEASATLKGLVLGANDAPVRGARLMAQTAGCSEGAMTDEGGHFEMRHLREGRYQVMVEAEDYRSLLAPAHTGEQAVFRLVPDQKPLTVRGRVVGPDGLPIAAFEVDGDDRGAPDGRFEVTRRPEDEDSLTVASDGFAPLSRTFVGKAGEVVDLGDLALSRGITVSGTVVEAGSLQPVADALFEVGSEEELREMLESAEHPNRNTRSRFARQPHTSTDGRFRVEHVAPSATHLFVFEWNHLPALLSLPAEREAIQVALRRGGEVRATVEDSEPGAFPEIVGWVRTANPILVPQHDGPAYEAPRLARVDSTGSFRVAGLTAGRYKVSATRPGDSAAVYSETEVDVAADGTASAVVSRKQGLDVMLRVFDPDGSVQDYPAALLAPGEVPLPKSKAELERISDAAEVATRLREGMGFAAVSPGRYTLFVTSWSGDTTSVYRRALDVSQDRQLVEVRLAPGLPSFPNPP
ncbi:MAG TPA: carboxypeptidase-like regulatory domain-containing protein [Myxococcales bacterium]